MWKDHDSNIINKIIIIKTLPYTKTQNTLFKSQRQESQYQSSALDSKEFIKRPSSAPLMHQLNEDFQCS